MSSHARRQWRAPRPGISSDQINSGNGGSGIIGKGSNVSSSPDAGGISGSSSGGGGGSISGAGSAGEDGMEVNKGKKRARTESGGASSETVNAVHHDQESSDRWFVSTHLAMVHILGNMFVDLQERHLGSIRKDPAMDDALLGFMQRIREIGQGVTAYTVSRLQTHSLISNTVQLCHRMAVDHNCRLGKGYPVGEQAELDIYDLSTDSGGEGSDEDDEEAEWDDERETTRRTSPARPKRSAAGTRQTGARVSNGKGVTGKRKGGGEGRGGNTGRGSVSIRQRFEAVVMSLVARAKWSAEQVGRPRKDVITRAREIVMAIFIDSYYRRKLSLYRLKASLQQVERIIAWADKAGEDGNVKEMLRGGLPLIDVGLANIALTAPES